MKVTIKYNQISKSFENKEVITIGNNSDFDFTIDSLFNGEILKLVYSEKYSNYIVVNASGSDSFLCNNKNFTKILAGKNFSLKNSKLPFAIEFNVEIPVLASVNSETFQGQIEKAHNQAINIQNNNTSGFEGEIEKNRVAIVKEIGYKIFELKSFIKSASNTSFALNVTMVVLCFVCSFAITNFLLGLKISTSASSLNLTTNFGFLICVSAILITVCMLIKQAVFSLLDYNNSRRVVNSSSVHKFIVQFGVIFMIVIYFINLLYYNQVPNFVLGAIFISFLFVGALVISTMGSGYFKFQSEKNKLLLSNYEYREDFESVMKNYRILIHKYLNSLSQNRINNIKNNLVNNQMKMVVEFFVGLFTSPFLAYGVSNTLAGCFPEAANWVRISGLRFSPVFLVLSTFLIIFAFFSFVRSFTLGKQIKGSEVIKFDGFHDYNSHGVTILGLDSTKSLDSERKIVLFIACFIILIEFTMNVSYFVSEIGSDVQGMFLSFVTALVPTALLIAETNLLSETMFKINNCNELLNSLD